MADLLTTSQVQDLLRVDRTTIYRMVEDGRLSAIRVGKQWRFPKEDLERWLQTQASRLAPVVAVHQAQGPQTEMSPAGAPLSDVLPMACVQLIQDAFAEMLGVMLVVTDMQGRPITHLSNPCGFFAAAIQASGGNDACTRAWQQLAAGLTLEPRFVPSAFGLLCARGLIRLGSELKGVVIAGGIAPEVWPPSNEQLAGMAREVGAEPTYLEANVNAVHQLDKLQREKVLRSVQRIADIFSHIAEDRSLIYGRLQAIASLTAL